MNRIGGKLVLMIDGKKYPSAGGSFSYNMGNHDLEVPDISKVSTGSITCRFKWTGQLKLYPYKGKKRIREKYKKRFHKLMGMPYFYPNGKNIKRINDFYDALFPSAYRGDQLDNIANLYGVERSLNECNESLRMRVLNAMRSVGREW